MAQYQILNLQEMAKYKPSQYERLPSGSVVLKEGVTPLPGTIKPFAGTTGAPLAPQAPAVPSAPASPAQPLPPLPGGGAQPQPAGTQGLSGQAFSTAIYQMMNRGQQNEELLKHRAKLLTHLYDRSLTPDELTGLPLESKQAILSGDKKLVELQVANMTEIMKTGSDRFDNAFKYMIEGYKMDQDNATKLQQQAEAKKKEAFDRIQFMYQQGGSQAFAKFSPEQKRAVEAAAGMQPGYLDQLQPTLAEQREGSLEQQREFQREMKVKEETWERKMDIARLGQAEERLGIAGERLALQKEKEVLTGIPSGLEKFLKTYPTEFQNWVKRTGQTNPMFWSGATAQSVKDEYDRWLTSPGALSVTKQREDKIREEFLDDKAKGMPYEDAIRLYKKDIGEKYIDSQYF